METLTQVMHVLTYVSMAILVLGLILFGQGKSGKVNYWFYLYFGVLLGIELLSYNSRSNNLFLFSIASFINFAFLFYYYGTHIFKVETRKLIPVILIGMAPMIIGLSSADSSLNFQSYDRFIYSLCIMLLSLYTFYFMLNQDETVSKEQIILNSAVLLFFTVETFLAIGTNYLINESLMLVAWFWFLRVILLQVFYGSIIYYAWQIGKTP